MKETITIIKDYKERIDDISNRIAKERDSLREIYEELESLLDAIDSAHVDLLNVRADFDSALDNLSMYL